MEEEFFWRAVAEGKKLVSAKAKKVGVLGGVSEEQRNGEEGNASAAASRYGTSSGYGGNTVPGEENNRGAGGERSAAAGRSGE